MSGLLLQKRTEIIASECVLAWKVFPQILEGFSANLHFCRLADKSSPLAGNVGFASGKSRPVAGKARM
jgi:hypothetical protein